LTSGGQYLFNSPIVGERTVRPSGLADRVKLRCAVHASESAEIVILPHPFFASTSHAGEFSIAGIPEGKRAIAVWRPGAAVAHGTTEVAPSLTRPAVLMVRAESLDVRRD
jgi:hypothetical protein